MLVTAIAIIVVALIFDFINGFHDAANSIATVVATKVLKPLWAVAWAAFFNFFAAFFGVRVATTIGKDVINSQVVDPYLILAALIGAILWDLITWYAGLPTSSSHALVGGLVGAALAKAPTIASLHIRGIMKIVMFIVLSPFIGLVLGLLIMILVSWVCRHKNPGKVDKWFRRLQLFSAAGYSLGHGMNDAQKTMGIIWMLLIAINYSPHLSSSIPGFIHWFVVGPAGANVQHVLPPWVKILCCAAIAAGTTSGGWRIVHTMGMKLTKLRPPGGFSAETAGALTLIGVSHYGIPVSTTHTITGAIVGVGSVRRLSAVRWGVAGRIVWAWVLTIPAAALIGAAAHYVIHLIMH